jgi:DNA-binding transcriptional LysR family regulator
MQMVAEDMAIFVAIVEAGSFSTASQRLEMPKSTVSFRIARLEERLGVQLLQRTTRVVRPTELGRIYYDRCKQILIDVAEIEDALLQHKGVTAGTIRLAAPVEFGMHILGAIVASFKVAHPRIHVDVELTSRHIDLVDERFDLAIRIGKLSDSSLIVRKLISVERQLFAAPQYIAAQGDPTVPEDLEKQDCLHFSSPYVPLLWTLERRGKKIDKVTVTPQVVVRINNLTMLRDSALAGIGIAALPRYMCADAVGRGALKVVLEDWQPESADVFVLRPGGRHISPKVRAFIDHLEGEMRRMGHPMLEPAPF